MRILWVGWVQAAMVFMVVGIIPNLFSIYLPDPNPIIHTTLLHSLEFTGGLSFFWGAFLQSLSYLDEIGKI